MALTLMSPAFADGDSLPEKYVRRGDNVMPPLIWTGVPEDARSLALLIEDPDAPRGTFRHCAAFNIPAGWSGLPERADSLSVGKPRFATNDFGNARYDGPEPPAGHGVHHYHFRVAALNVAHLSIPHTTDADAMWQAVQKHVIAEAELTGVFETH